MIVPPIEVDLGIESVTFDERLAARSAAFDIETRAGIWASAEEILDHGPLGEQGESVTTGLALGRIQSGKTTAMTALIALARDRGYRLVIAILGSTNLLLDQNAGRLLEGLGIGNGLRSTYGWIHLAQDGLERGGSRRVDDAARSDRTVIITILKHPRHIEKVTELLRGSDAANLPTLIIDDEADQASLNTRVRQESDSATHASIVELLSTLSNALYVQFTATPYAPLLVDSQDVLSPSFVVFLTPGQAYTGASRFFIEEARKVIRVVPRQEAADSHLRSMPHSLSEALANYLLGAAWLLALDGNNAPVSMLVHASHKQDVHHKLENLIRRQLDVWDDGVTSASSLEELPSAFHNQIADLEDTIGTSPPQGILEMLRRVMVLRHVWVVNSSAAEASIDWSISPAHILIGGNKLDRGFTVEGLTVTYLSRARSAQLDTLYQRARAFGYRSEYLPFCRFFADQRTLNSFREGINTDLAMRESLRSWIAVQNDVGEWADSEPLFIEKGLRPTRAAVVSQLLSQDVAGWHVVSRPSLDADSIAHNRDLVVETGLLDAPAVRFGHLEHLLIERLPIADAVLLLRGWRHSGTAVAGLEAVASYFELGDRLGWFDTVPLLYLEGVDGRARERSWTSAFGITSLMQGRDANYAGASTPDLYPGDRYLLDSATQLQIYRVHLKDSGVEELLAMSVRVGDDHGNRVAVRRQV